MKKRNYSEVNRVGKWFDVAGGGGGGGEVTQGRRA